MTPQIKTIGHSVLGQPILLYRFESTSLKKVLILGGVHGNEVEGVCVAQKMISALCNDMPFQFGIDIVPMINPDGVLSLRRTNTNLVDLNRNLPTKDWSPEIAEIKYHPGPKPASEPENKALITLLDKNKYHTIVSLHSYDPMLNINGDCRPLAERISQFTGDPVTESIGYPTPGSLGTYAGNERNIPTLTYELKRGENFATLIESDFPALMEGLKIFNS